MPLEEIDKEQAFKDEKDVYGNPTRSIPRPEKDIGVDNDNELLKEIATRGIANNIDISALESFTSVSQNRNTIYDTIDAMCEDTIVASILETYAEDATEYNDEGRIVWAESDDTAVSAHINYLLQSMQVDKQIFKWCINLCKYGDVYVKLIRQSEMEQDDIFSRASSMSTRKQLHENMEKDSLKEDVAVKAFAKNDHYTSSLEMQPNPATMFELTRYGKTYGYIKTNVMPTNASAKDSANMFLGTQYKFKQNDVTIYQATSFVHGTLENTSSRTPEEVTIFRDTESYNSDTDGYTYTVKRGQSLFQNLFKIWRELTLLEQSVMLNRVTKSSILRIISVEVGDMPKESVQPLLQRVKALIEQKSAINAGQSMTEYTNPGPVENNIYIPTNDGKGAITTNELGGNTEVGKLADLDYFKNKFYGGAAVPKQFLGDTDDTAGFSGGESLARISSRYAKRIKRIQKALTTMIEDIVNLRLLDSGLQNYIGKFEIHMQPPSTVEAKERRDEMQSKTQIATDVLQMVGDLEDPVAKLKITKSLLTNIITNDEVMQIIQQEIDKMEADSDDAETETPKGEETDEESFDSSTPLGLGDKLGLTPPSAPSTEEEPMEEPTETETSAEELPTPEELDVGDLSDNNNPNL